MGAQACQFVLWLAVGPSSCPGAMVLPWTDPKVVAVGLNAFLAFGCTDCILLATWPFNGLMNQWFFPRHRYTWPTHIMMLWFEIGCIGLFVTNLYAFLVYKTLDPLPREIWDGNWWVNFVMHLLWGFSNGHQFILIMRGVDKGTEGEYRRAGPPFFWSCFGSCGTGTIRNFLHIYSAEVSQNVNLYTGIYEFFCLNMILLDLFYFLAKEHVWGANKEEGYGKGDAHTELTSS